MEIKTRRMLDPAWTLDKAAEYMELYYPEDAEKKGSDPWMYYKFCRYLNTDRWDTWREA
jgi:hypothetical protein